MNLKLRKYEEKDLKSASYEFTQAFKGNPWNEDWTIEEASLRISEIMDSKLSRGFVCIDQDTKKIAGLMIGRVMSMLDFREYWIDDFSVNPKYQGQGIGTKLLEYAKQEIRKEFSNIKTFNLITRKGYPCYDYYLNKGFKNDGFNTYIYLDL